MAGWLTDGLRLAFLSVAWGDGLWGQIKGAKQTCCLIKQSLHQVKKAKKQAPFSVADLEVHRCIPTLRLFMKKKTFYETFFSSDRHNSTFGMGLCDRGNGHR